jgi:hypothetical protein
VPFPPFQSEATSSFGERKKGPGWPCFPVGRFLNLHVGVSDESVSFAVQKGIQISRSTVKVFKHNDMADLEAVLQKVAIEQKKVIYHWLWRMKVGLLMLSCRARSPSVDGLLLWRDFTRIKETLRLFRNWFVAYDGL